MEKSKGAGTKSGESYISQKLAKEVARVEAQLKAAGIPLPEEIRNASKRDHGFDKTSPFSLPIPLLTLNLHERELNGRKKTYVPPPPEPPAPPPVTAVQRLEVMLQPEKCWVPLQAPAHPQRTPQHAFSCMQRQGLSLAGSRVGRLAEDESTDQQQQHSKVELPSMAASAHRSSSGMGAAGVQHRRSTHQSLSLRQSSAATDAAEVQHRISENQSLSLRQSRTATGLVRSRASPPKSKNQTLSDNGLPPAAVPARAHPEGQSSTSSPGDNVSSSSSSGKGSPKSSARNSPRRSPVASAAWTNGIQDNVRPLQPQGSHTTHRCATGDQEWRCRAGRGRGLAGDARCSPPGSSMRSSMKTAGGMSRGSHSQSPLKPRVVFPSEAGGLPCGDAPWVQASGGSKRLWTGAAALPQLSQETIEGRKQLSTAIRRLDTILQDLNLQEQQQQPEPSDAGSSDSPTSPSKLLKKRSMHLRQLFPCSPKDSSMKGSSIGQAASHTEEEAGGGESVVEAHQTEES